MPKPRPFLYADSQAGVFHVVSRAAGREYRLGEEEKEFFTKLVHAYARLLGVEVLTHCTMSNHFHLLVRVPQRPGEFAEESGGPSVETLLDRLEAAVGGEQMKQIRQNLRLWEDNEALDLIEAWRRRQVEAMYSLSEFMKRVKQRFTRWYNKRTGRVGIFWEDRYRSTIVQDDGSALRTMATYIDLNPVRAGIVDDPGNYRWCGYAEAMAGKAEAVEGIVKLTGTTVDNVYGRALGEESKTESPAQRRRRQMRALVAYRQILGVAGRERVREDGKVIRRGVNAKVQARFDGATGVKREQLLRRVRHFTGGVILGSRSFIDDWFERNRGWFGGRSAEHRKTGARKIGKEWKELYNLRQLRSG